MHHLFCSPVPWLGTAGALSRAGVIAGLPRSFMSSASRYVAWSQLRYARRKRSYATSLELRSAVFGPTRACRRVGIRKLCVCRGEENLRSEVPSDLPGGIARPAGTMQAVFYRGQILR